MNKNGPGRYRSLANYPEKQVCYFNKPGDDVFYNTFITERIKENKYSEGIYFRIEKVRGSSDRENFDAKRILEDGTSNARSDGIFDAPKPEQSGTGTIRAGIKRFGELFENLYRRNRKTAKPKFLL